MSNSGFPIILAIDTSSSEARLAVSVSESVIAALSVRNNRPHSQTLFSQISILLQLVDIKVDEISAFAVGVGPGSFTGLRVGLAAVKGLADSLNRPCLGVDSLDLHALASGINGAHLVMLCAGRGEVYCGFRDVASGDIIDRPVSDKVGKPLSVLRAMTEYLTRSPLIIVGDGGYIYKDEVSDLINQLRSVQSAPADGATEPIFLKPDLNISSVLAQRAALLMKQNRTAPAAPRYIRQSDAEIEWKRRQ
ncbi:MAG: tRNA (adenosine(37)-N6)-threonylcarbamoyltransferase complex dimerization subunit type 1 TsaB [Blastocatellia bacterium]